MQELVLQAEALDTAKLIRVFPQAWSCVTRLEQIQKHTYVHKKVALTALIHRSVFVFWPQDRSGMCSNERLEFLGDSFLNFFVAHQLMQRHALLQEGMLSRLRAALVSTKNLGQKSTELGLGECLLTADKDVSAVHSQTQNMLADVFEAVTAALFVDGGQDAAGRWLESIFAQDFLVRDADELAFDAKGKLQRMLQQTSGVAPIYRVVGTESTPQQGRIAFVVAVYHGQTELARAVGLSKQEASQKAAEIALYTQSV